MSDFRPSDYGSQMLFSDNQILCREEFEDYDESSIIMSATTQERINADLQELAAASIILRILVTCYVGYDYHFLLTMTILFK